MYSMSICPYLAHIYSYVRSGTYYVYSNTYHYVPNLNYVPIRTKFICASTYQYVSATKYVPICTVIYIPIRTKIRTNSQIVEIRTPDWPKYVPHFPIRTTIDRNSHWWRRQTLPMTMCHDAFYWLTTERRGCVCWRCCCCCCCCQLMLRGLLLLLLP